MLENTLSSTLTTMEFHSNGQEKSEIEEKNYNDQEKTTTHKKK